MFKLNVYKGMSAIVIVSNEDIDKYINIIKAQTNYDDYFAVQKLKEFNYDYMKVIRDYMGIKDKKVEPIKSVNQEIYKQIRRNLDTTMKEYREKNPVNLEQVKTNLQESEEKEKDKNKK
jgi:gas vesicle protein